LVKDLSADRADSLSAVNTIVGTPHYIAPEVLLGGDNADERSDIYALGVLGYYLLTGSFPFDGRSHIEICSEHLTAAPRPLREIESSVPTDLEQLLLGCLSKDPTQRPPSASALRERLGECEDADAWSERDATSWWQHIGKALVADKTPSPRGATSDLLSIVVER